MSNVEANNVNNDAGATQDVRTTVSNETTRFQFRAPTPALAKIVAEGAKRKREAMVSSPRSASTGLEVTQSPLYREAEVSRPDFAKSSSLEGAFKRKKGKLPTPKKKKRTPKTVPQTASWIHRPYTDGRSPVLDRHLNQNNREKEGKEIVESVHSNSPDSIHGDPLEYRGGVYSQNSMFNPSGNLADHFDSALTLADFSLEAYEMARTNVPSFNANSDPLEVSGKAQVENLEKPKTKRKRKRTRSRKGEGSASGTSDNSALPSSNGKSRSQTRTSSKRLRTTYKIPVHSPQLMVYLKDHGRKEEEFYVKYEQSVHHPFLRFSRCEGLVAALNTLASSAGPDHLVVAFLYGGSNRFSAMEKYLHPSGKTFTFVDMLPPGERAIKGDEAKSISVPFHTQVDAYVDLDNYFFGEESEPDFECTKKRRLCSQIVTESHKPIYWLTHIFHDDLGAAEYQYFPSASPAHQHLIGESIYQKVEVDTPNGKKHAIKYFHDDRAIFTYPMHQDVTPMLMEPPPNVCLRFLETFGTFYLFSMTESTNQGIPSGIPWMPPKRFEAFHVSELSDPDNPALSTNFVKKYFSGPVKVKIGVSYIDISDSTAMDQFIGLQYRDNAAIKYMRKNGGLKQLANYQHDRYASLLTRFAHADAAWKAFESRHDSNVSSLLFDGTLNYFKAVEWPAMVVTASFYNQTQDNLNALVAQVRSNEPLPSNFLAWFGWVVKNLLRTTLMPLAKIVMPILVGLLQPWIEFQKWIYGQGEQFVLTVGGLDYMPKIRDLPFVVLEASQRRRELGVLGHHPNTVHFSLKDIPSLYPSCQYPTNTKMIPFTHSEMSLPPTSPCDKEGEADYPSDYAGYVEIMLDEERISPIYHPGIDIGQATLDLHNGVITRGEYYAQMTNDSAYIEYQKALVELDDLLKSFIPTERKPDVETQVTHAIVRTNGQMFQMSNTPKSVLSIMKRLIRDAYKGDPPVIYQTKEVNPNVAGDFQAMGVRLRAIANLFIPEGCATDLWNNRRDDPELEEMVANMPRSKQRKVLTNRLQDELGIAKFDHTQINPKRDEENLGVKHPLDDPDFEFNQLKNSRAIHQKGMYGEVRRKEMSVLAYRATKEMLNGQPFSLPDTIPSGFRDPLMAEEVDMLTLTYQKERFGLENFSDVDVRILYASGKNVSDLNQFLNEDDGSTIQILVMGDDSLVNIPGVGVVEIDHSMYDNCQTELFIEHYKENYLRMGFPRDIVDDWGANFTKEFHCRFPFKKDGVTYMFRFIAHAFRRGYGTGDNNTTDDATRGNAVIILHSILRLFEKYTNIFTLDGDARKEAVEQWIKESCYELGVIAKPLYHPTYFGSTFLKHVVINVSGMWSFIPLPSFILKACKIRQDPVTLFGVKDPQQAAAVALFASAMSRDPEDIYRNANIPIISDWYAFAHRCGITPSSLKSVRAVDRLSMERRHNVTRNDLFHLTDEEYSEVVSLFAERYSVSPEDVLAYSKVWSQLEVHDYFDHHLNDAFAFTDY
jgi:hypothetical protein